MSCRYPTYQAQQMEKAGTMMDYAKELSSPDTLGLPCPLLDTVTGSCRVYHARPWVCRAYGVTTFLREEFQVCDIIPSNLENARMTPDICDLEDEFWEAKYIDVAPKTRAKDVKYPIVYWLRRLFFKNAPTGRLEVSVEEEDFRTPLRVAAQKRLRMAERQIQQRPW